MSQVFLFLTKFNYVPIVKFYIKDNFITFKITVKVASDVNCPGWISATRKLSTQLWQTSVKHLIGSTHFTVHSKLYIPSTLNIDLILWRTQIDCVCSKMLNYGSNHRWFLSLFKFFLVKIHSKVNKFRIKEKK